MLSFFSYQINRIASISVLKKEKVSFFCICKNESTRCTLFAVFLIIEIPLQLILYVVCKNFLILEKFSKDHQSYLRCKIVLCWILVSAWCLFQSPVLTSTITREGRKWRHFPFQYGFFTIKKEISVSPR